MALWAFGELLIVFSTKVNLLYLAYSMARRLCLLHLIKQNCFVVLKNCEPELSYIPAELFNKCLKESCFPDGWKAPSVVPVLKNVAERSTAKNYRSVSLLFVVSKVFKNLTNDKIVDHLEKCSLFSDF